MTQEEKQILLKDLCARLPYGVKATTTLNGWRDVYIVSGYKNDRIYLDCPIYDEGDDEWLIESVKPYLRQMSSMTRKEKSEYNSLCDIAQTYHYEFGDIVEDVELYDNFASIAWLYEHHFDCCGLIERGLALEAPEGMYN